MYSSAMILENVLSGYICLTQLVVDLGVACDV